MLRSPLLPASEATVAPYRSHHKLAVVGGANGRQNREVNQRLGRQGVVGGDVDGKDALHGKAELGLVALAHVYFHLQQRHGPRKGIDDMMASRWWWWWGWGGKWNVGRWLAGWLVVANNRES